MTEEKDVWEVEERALLDIENVPGGVMGKVSAVVQGIHQYKTENLSDS